MLVLTRKVDQGIVISGNIYVRVLGVERDRVKIGISAPTDVPVLRQELLDRDQNQANATHLKTNDAAGSAASTKSREDTDKAS
jgi:carbon storage regulator